MTQFDHDGKTYFLPRLTEGDKDRWLSFCNAFARKQLAKARREVEEGWLDYGEYMLIAKENQDRRDTGYYHYDEEGGQAFLRAEHTLVALIWICMARHDPSLKLADVQALAKAMGSELGRQFWEANAHPTAVPASAGDSPPATPKPENSSAGA